MTASRLVKKTSCNKRQCNKSNEYTLIPIKSIPQDLLINVVARVSSESYIDHYNMKVCCRDFFHASKDNYMWQQVSLEKFPLIPWLYKEDASMFDSFMQSCKGGGNIEALYRVGLRELKSFVGNVDNGIKYLKMAAEKGHLESKYTYALILLCSYDDDFRKQGVEYLKFLRNSKCAVNCRNKVIALLGRQWRRPYGTLERNPTPLCCNKPCKGWNLKKGTWQLVDNEDDDDTIENSCENCRWDVELDFVYDVLFCNF